jgi:hypothetical protein
MAPLPGHLILSIIVFDLYHLFRKKAELQGFIKKLITHEVLKIGK